MKLKSIDLSGSRVTTVIFDDGGFREDYMGYGLGIYKFHEIEVIGNVYENPDLLTAKRKQIGKEKQMDTLGAFAMGMANRGKELRVFDWEKAATIIKERNMKEAYAGLLEDWDWENGQILHEGVPTIKGNASVFLASTWATPVLLIGNEFIPCFRIQSKTPGWDHQTFWPREAREILDWGVPDTDNGQEICEGDIVKMILQNGKKGGSL